VRHRRGRAPRLSVLARLQRGLETLYRIESQLAIDAFVINAASRAALATARTPREQLLVREDNDELGMALFVDAAALSNLERHDPAARLDDRNFTDFCLAVEGVSHFVYVARCAAAGRCVSPLELELQAEVDKFICCWMLVGTAEQLRRRLYGDVIYADDLNDDERDRYRTANQEASRYTRVLVRQFVERRQTDAMLSELRRFYRMDLADKLGHIARLS